MSDISIPALPSPLAWLNQPQSWNWSPNSELTITAEAHTDWFIDPQGAYSANNAPALLFASHSPCLLSAYITVNYAATYDAGVLALYQQPHAWAKLCLELSPHRQLTVVSVVTRGVSDDCNAVGVVGQSAYLRVARLERAFAFHYSPDGVTWSLIRYFSLEHNADVQMGFLAQSPVGSGCAVTFAAIRYEPRLLADIRSGE
jgi:regulation of enolase protein 1 (concanavalin A-like superfamily)